MRHLDKAHHIVWSFALAVAGAFLLGPTGGLVIAALLGLAKEVWDGTRGRWCWWDMAANVVGLASAIIVMRGGLW